MGPRRAVRTHPRHVERVSDRCLSRERGPPPTVSHGDSVISSMTSDRSCRTCPPHEWKATFGVEDTGLAFRGAVRSGLRSSRPSLCVEGSVRGPSRWPSTGSPHRVRPSRLSLLACRSRCKISEYPRDLHAWRRRSRGPMRAQRAAKRMERTWPVGAGLYGIYDRREEKMSLAGIGETLPGGFAVAPLLSPKNATNAPFEWVRPS